MCVVEKRLYHYTDGRERTVETTKYCSRNGGKRLCNRVDRRTVQQANVVERRPSTADGPSDTRILTPGNNARTRDSRDQSNRSSNRSSVRRSVTLSDRSPVSNPSSSSSPPEAGPSTTYPFPDRTQTPYPSSPMSPRTVADDGTAIYDRPPSLDMPRASENERPNRRRRPSDSSMTAEVDDSLPPATPSPTRQRRRQSVRIDSGVGPTDPQRESFRTNDDTRRPDNRQPPRRQNSRREPGPSQRDSLRDQQPRYTMSEDERQARLEQDRLAGTDRRQSARESLSRQASQRAQDEDRQRRERHHRATADALEGRGQPPVDRIQALVNAEIQQMAREQAAAEARRRSSTDPAQSYAEDQVRRDAEARQRFYSTRRQSPMDPRPSSSRRMTGEFITSPASARSSTYRPPIVHHQSYQSYSPSASRVERRRDSISALGEDVIAREQARVAHERMREAFGDMRVDDADGEWLFDEETGEYVRAPVDDEPRGNARYSYYEDGGGRRRREGRHL